MANPYFTNSANFGQSKPQPGMTGAGYQPNAQGYAQPGPSGAPNPYGQTATYGSPSYGTPATDAQFQGIQDAYYGPAAGPAQTGRLSYNDVIIKTASVLAVIVLSAALAWFTVPESMVMPVMWIGILGGLGLGLVNSFKKEPSPLLILGYGLFEGAFLGLISKLFEYSYPGIVVQAVLATFITFAVTLALFSSGKVRVTPKFRKIVMIGLISYGIFCLANLFLSIFGVGGGWGLRDGALGLLIGAAAVVLCAMTLVMDFDQIARGVANGVPAKFAWSAAFGLALSLVWLYLEFLRMLAILRGD